MRMPSNLPQPTRQLGQYGLDLWYSIQSDYVIEDPGGIETLMQACTALDRAEIACGAHCGGRAGHCGPLGNAS